MLGVGFGSGVDGGFDGFFCRRLLMVTWLVVDVGQL